MSDISSAIEAILFAAGECVPQARLSMILGVEDEELELYVKQLQHEYESQQRGMRILKLGDKLQMCSAPEYAPLISKVLEQRKPPMLTQPALETLAVVAYFQPVTRAYIDQVRGVDSAYTVGVLLERGLIERCGKLDVPGRPSIFRTTAAFLRTMGVSDLSELPPLPEVSGSEGLDKLQGAIDQLQNAAQSGQITISEISQQVGE